MVYKKKKWWKPWANTILYLPMETDYQDHSSNQYTMTLNSWSLTKDGYSYFLSGSQYIYPKLNNNVVSESSLVWWTFPYTISTWAKSVSWVGSTSNYSPVRMSEYYNNGAISWGSYIIYWTSSRFEVFNNVDSWSTALTISDSTQWHLYTIVIRQSSQDIYQDTTKVGTFTKNYVLSTYTWADAPFCFQSRNYDYWRNKGWTLWITVVEKWERDIDKITTFYNWTKWNYWL